MYKNRLINVSSISPSFYSLICSGSGTVFTNHKKSFFSVFATPLMYKIIGLHFGLWFGFFGNKCSFKLIWIIISYFTLLAFDSLFLWNNDLSLKIIIIYTYLPTLIQHKIWWKIYIYIFFNCKKYDSNPSSLPHPSYLDLVGTSFISICQKVMINIFSSVCI